MSIIGKFTGAYEKIDDQVGEPMDKYMTPKGVYISQELYDPFYDPLDECLKNNDAECIRHIFDDFHKLDKRLTANINDPKIKAGYAEFTENMFKAGEEAADDAQKTGKVDLKKFDEEHKEINDKFYKIMD